MKKTKDKVKKRAKGSVGGRARVKINSSAETLPIPGTVASLPEKLKPHKVEDDQRQRSATKALVPYDALSAYLKEIKQYPPLSKEEEHDLAVKYYKNKDIEAAYRLVSSNLWLVVKLAKEYEKAARNLIDLIQEGNIGLMEAVKNFDPYRNVRFPSYAVWWVKAYIVRYVIANLRLVKLGTTQAQRKLFFNLQKEKDKLQKLGFYPAPKLLAEKLNVKESEVIEMEQRLGAPDVSVDAPLSTEGDTSLHSVLPDEAMSAEELVAEKQMQGKIKQLMRDFAKTLNEKESVIFRERMLGEDKATLQELAEHLSLSRERIRQIENRVKDKLKTFFADNFEGELDFIIAPD